MSDDINLDLSPLEDGVNAVNKTVKDISKSAKDTSTSVSGIEKQVEGIDLIEENTESLESQLKILKGINSNIVDLLNSVNKVYKIVENPEGDVELKETEELLEEAPEEEEETEEIFEYKINNSIVETRELEGLPNLGSLVGSGFSLLANTFKDLQQSMLNSFSELTKILLESQAPIQQEAPENEEIKTQSSLRTFLESMAGPLETVASSILVLTVAVTALSLLPISTELIAKMAVISLTLGALFVGLREISRTAEENRELINPENENSVTARVQELAVTLALVSATFVGMVVMVNFLKDNVSSLLIGFGLTTGLLLVTMGTLKLLAVTMDSNKDLVGEKSPIVEFVKGFAMLIGTIAITTAISGFLWEQMLTGIAPTLLIVGFASIMLRSVIDMADQIEGEGAGEKIESVSKVIKQFTILIGTISLLTIVLGIIPMDIILQGLVTFGVMVVLTDFMITSIFKAADELDGAEDKIDQLSRFMVTVSIFLALETAIVLVLGSMPLGVLIQGFASITLMFLSIYALNKLVSGLKVSPQAIVAMIALTAFTLMVGATATLIAGMFNLIPGGAGAVMQSALALIVTTAAFAIIGLATVGLAALATVLGVAFLPAMAAIGIISIASLAVAATAAAIVIGWKALEIKAEEVNAIALALINTSLAFVTMGLSVITLAALAIPLGLSIKGALISVSILQSFAVSVVESLKDIGKIEVGELDTTPIKKIDEMLKTLATSSVSLVASSLVLVTVLAGLVGLSKILSLELASVAISLASVGFSLRMLSLIEPPEDLENLTKLVESLHSVNEAIEALDDIKTIPPLKRLAITSTLDFLSKLPEKMKFKSSETLATEQLREFASAVKELSDAGSGLEGLANHLNDVLKATADLQKDSAINIKSSAESISKMSTKFENFGSIKLDRESVELKNASKIEEKLTDLIELLRQNVQATKQVASVGVEQVDRSIINNQMTMESKF